MRPRHRLLAAAVLGALGTGANAVERVPLPAPEPLPAAAPAAMRMPAFLEHFGIESWWDVVQFQPWTASIAVSLDDQEQRLKSPSLPAERSSSRLASETFSVQNDGISVVTPKLFNAGISLGFMATQQRQETLGIQSAQAGRLLNYSFNGAFLQESPYTGTVTAVRSQNNYVLPSGTTTRSDYTSRAFNAHLREQSILREREWLPYFTSNFRAAEQTERQTTTSGSQVYRQDDRRRNVAFDFQNGGINSDLSFQYQYTTLDNYAYPDGSYKSQNANLFYSLDFGPTLNWRWDSRTNWYKRVGSSALSDSSTFEVNESLTIDHDVSRSSIWNYVVNRQGSPFGDTTSQVATAMVNQQVFNNLGLSGTVNASRTDVPGGKLATTGGSGSLSYAHGLPWGGQMTLNGGGSYAVSSTKVPGGLVLVSDAPFAVPQVVGAGSAIALKDRNIDVSTIVVVVVKGGARTTAFEGIDYTVRVDGDLVSILPLPSSALMLPGDPLNISYSYFVQPDSKYASTSRSASMSGEWGWIGFSLSHDQSGQKSLGGDDSLLLDQRRDVAQLYLRGAWEDLTVRAGAGMTDYDSTRLAYLEHRLDQYVAWAPVPGMMVSFAGAQGRTQYRIDPHTTRNGSYRVDLSWATPGGWVNSAYLGRRLYDDTRQPHETVDEAGLRMRRTWARLDLNFALGMQRRIRGEVSAVNGFVHLNLVRRF